MYVYNIYISIRPFRLDPYYIHTPSSARARRRTPIIYSVMCMHSGIAYILYVLYTRIYINTSYYYSGNDDNHKRIVILLLLRACKGIYNIWNIYILYFMYIRDVLYIRIGLQTSNSCVYIYRTHSRTDIYRVSPSFCSNRFFETSFTRTAIHSTIATL